jgi:hypothetical protein
MMRPRPWLSAIAAAAGITLLVPAAFALLAPPEMLDEAVAMGDGRLVLALVSLFVVSACFARLSWRRREEPAEEEPALAVEKDATRSYLR